MAGEQAGTGEPRVTIVVTARERYALTMSSLDSVYAATSQPFRLVYVDNNSPARVRRELEAASVARGFELRRTDRYVSPNVARNVGLRGVTTEFVAFLDNDVYLMGGWLDRLVGCADETGAWVVGPLYLEGELDPVNGTVHMAAGDMRFTGEWGSRTFQQIQRHYLESAAAVPPDAYRRQRCDIVEFHCALVRTDAFAKVGAMDEALLSTREHLDFCLRVLGAGGEVWFEPESVVTYASPPPIDWHDVAYFSLRWSDRWTRDTVAHFASKWGIDPSYTQERIRKNRAVRGRILRDSIAPPGRHGTARAGLATLATRGEAVAGRAFAAAHALRDRTPRVRTYLPALRAAAAPAAAETTLAGRSRP